MNSAIPIGNLRTLYHEGEADVPAASLYPTVELGFSDAQRSKQAAWRAQDSVIPTHPIVKWPSLRRPRRPPYHSSSSFLLLQQF
ncbi:hypothetical protein R1flu_026776 [Riccia fluitans]|uniref:Uncharacterized protein n=1 Tax=Riccia fluitans TaxID=41844 RepID=A0ABD1XKY6_9MARC